MLICNGDYFCIWGKWIELRKNAAIKTQNKFYSKIWLAFICNCKMEEQLILQK